MNFADLPFEKKTGTRNDRNIVVYALSTCGFCRKAMSFLDDEGFSYSFIHVDKIPLDTKNELKKELKEKFNENVAFPFAVIDDKDHLVGFIRPDWERTLGLAAK
ncbi:MAG: glutaredoxin family protein [Spirochaetota bacterium]